MWGCPTRVWDEKIKDVKMGFNVGSINGNLQRDQHSSLVFPQNPPPHPPAHVTHRLRSCHRGQNTRARTPATADMSVTLHFHTHKHKLSPTITHTVSWRSSCRPDRQSPSLLPLTGGRIPRSDGKCAQQQFDQQVSHRQHATRAVKNVRVSLACLEFLTPSAPRVTRLQGG